MSNISKTLHLPVISQIDYILRKYGIEGYKKAYEENLLLVLEEVAKTIQLLRWHTQEKIVITSDHGELLGEHDRVGHPDYKNNLDYLELKEVPYFTVMQ